MKTAIIYDPDFPFDGQRPDENDIRILAEVFEIISPLKCSRKLEESEYSCILNLHGRYFDPGFWKGFKRHLYKGRGFVNLGGGLFTNTVETSKDGVDAFRIGQDCTAYHREMNISNIFKVHGSDWHFETNPQIKIDSNYLNLFENMETSEYSVRFTHNRDNPGEHGSSGPMEAKLIPLAFAVSPDGRREAAPAVMIENTKYRFAGGRWIFVNQDATGAFWQKGGAEFLCRMLELASQPVIDIVVLPGYATYFEGERPLVKINCQVLGNVSRELKLELKVCKESGEQPKDSQCTGYSTNMTFTADSRLISIELPLELKVEKGFYKIEAAMRGAGEERLFVSGFWGYDGELLKNAGTVTPAGDYFACDGSIVPVTGMTYMASDVHRKYLFLPNPAVWMEDFLLMKRAGVNLVRSGIWTYYRSIMKIDGHADEGVLRAIDAFMLTAAYHRIHVIFNFFAFTPEMWEGVNPYLDPVCLEAQKRFVSSVVQRHAASSNVSWDLINEPSVCNPDRVFQGPQPNGDRYELAEWRRWLSERYGNIKKLRAEWNRTPEDFEDFSDIMLPDGLDLAVVGDRTCIPHPPQTRIRALMSADYGLFTNHVFDKWVGEMTGLIKSFNPAMMVAVGQDHATSGRRPHPYFHGRITDYTSVHSWWMLDDLYWDSAFVKIPGKPALVQETGIMYVEDNNERYRRSEDECARILERKLAYAFASGGAGVVPWILNTNVYMEDENEIHIGMLRADGTEKPEFKAVRDFYRFMAASAGLFGNRIDEKVYVLFSFSNSYSNRDYSNISTRKSSRILSFNLKTSFCGLSDHNISSARSPALIICPCPRVLPEDAWRMLVQKADEGAVVFITGPLNNDGAWQRIERTREWGVESELASVSREETLLIGQKEYGAAFDGQLTGWVDKEIVKGDQASGLYSFNCGKGKVVWCPLPLEMNLLEEVIEEAYKEVFKLANLKNDLEIICGSHRGIFLRKLDFEKGCIYFAISEDGMERKIRFRDRITGFEADFILKAGRAVMLAADNRDRLLESYGI